MADNGRPLRLLSLDGGGVKGLSSLYILKDIMKKIRQRETDDNVNDGSNSHSLRPCDYFDMIAGTSTGGLIAIMLGILRMDIMTCIDAYLKMAKVIFPESRISSWWKGKVVLGGYRYEPGPLEAAVKDLIDVHLPDCMSETVMMRGRPDNGCKVFVCATTAEPRTHYRFRDYESNWNITDDVAIWEACRATSAAPTFFPPMFIGDPSAPYVDGGIGYNNPIRALLDERSHVWPSRDIGCIISIGTGMSSLKDVGTSIQLLKTLKDIATDTEQVASEIQKEMDHQQSFEQAYFRFNVQHGLENIELEEWKEMARIKTATENYLRTEYQRIKGCVSQLHSHSHRTQSISHTKKTKAFSTVRFPRDKNFVGRKSILTTMNSEFATLQDRRWVSLSGFGGMGKSQIAIEYSYQIREHSPQISTFWVHASSRARFEQSYGDIVTSTGIRVTADDSLNLLKSVSQWLADEDNGPWFLILDNLDDATVLLNVSPNASEGAFASNDRALIEFIPQVKHGAVLITSRDDACCMKMMDHCGKPIKVEALSPHESIQLLRSRVEEASDDDAKELVDELENIPLAITQAGAYIKELSPLITTRAYLEDFRRSLNHSGTLLKYDNGDLRRDIGGSNSVIATWEISFNHIKDKYATAARYLSLMSCFNHHAIPQWLITDTKHKDVPQFQLDIKPLLSFSLIRAEVGGGMFEMHRLVQVAMRHWLRKNKSRYRWMTVAIERMLGSVYARSYMILSSHADEIHAYQSELMGSLLRHLARLNRSLASLALQSSPDTSEYLDLLSQFRLIQDHIDREEVTYRATAILRFTYTTLEYGATLSGTTTSHGQESIATEHGGERKMMLYAGEFLAAINAPQGEYLDPESLLDSLAAACCESCGFDHPPSLPAQTNRICLSIGQKTNNEAGTLMRHYLEASRRSNDRMKIKSQLIFLLIISCLRLENTVECHT